MKYSEDIEQTLTHITALAVIDSFLQSESSEYNRTRNSFFPLPKSLDFIHVEENLRFSNVTARLRDMLYCVETVITEADIREFTTHKMETLRCVRNDFHNCILNDEYEDLLEAILESDAAEYLLFTLSNNGVLLLSELVTMLSRNILGELYKKLDPRGIVYTMFMSSEFESQIPTKTFVSNKSAFDLVIDSIVTPALAPFLTKQKKAEKTLQALSDFVIMSLTMIEASKLLVSNSVTTERVIVFEHIMEFVNRHKKKLISLEVSDKLIRVFVIEPHDDNLQHPLLSKFFYRTLGH